MLKHFNISVQCTICSRSEAVLESLCVIHI